MDNIGFFTVDEAYVNALSSCASSLFHNAKTGQINSRKYIGIVFKIGSYEYFAPLSSFKEKHRKMKNGMDFIKVKDYAVINLNCMFPVPASVRHRVNFKSVQDQRYKQLLLAEYRVILGIQDRIRKNAQNLYKHKIQNGTTTKLAARCVDFGSLEKICDQWSRREQDKKKPTSKRLRFARSSFRPKRSNADCSCLDSG